MKIPRYFQVTTDSAVAIKTQTYSREFILWMIHVCAEPLTPALMPIFNWVEPIVLWTYAKKWRRRAIVGVAFAAWCIFLLVTRAHGITPSQCTNGNGPGAIDQASNELNGALSSWPDAVITSIAFPFEAIMGLAVLVTLLISFSQAAGGKTWGWELFFGTALSFGLAFSFFQAAPTFGPSLTDYIISKGTSLPTGPALTPAYSSISAISPGDAWMRFSCMSGEIYQASQKSDNVFNFFKHPITTLEVSGADWAAQGITFAAAAFSSFELLAVKIEAPIVLAVGAILVLGLAAPMLWSFPMQYLGAIVGLGLKVLALSIIAGLLFMLGDVYSASLNAAANSEVGITPNVAWTVAWGLAMGTAALVFVPNILQRLGGSPGMPGGSMIAAIHSGGNSVGSWASRMFGSGSEGDGSGGGGDAAAGVGEAAANATTEAAETVPEVVLP